MWMQCDEGSGWKSSVKYYHNFNIPVMALHKAKALVNT